MFRAEFNSTEIRESIIGTPREESARGMSESKTVRERKAGGKNVCARIRGERSAKGRERKSVKKKRAKGRESEKITEKIRERKRERERVS